jgi:putative nucleotidyltransferase with HDIG domain
MDAQIDGLCELEEQRAILSAYLIRIRARIVSRVKAVCEIDPRTNVLVDAFIFAFVDRLLPSIQKDYWDDTCDWIDIIRADSDDADIRKYCMLATLRTLDTECELALPTFAPLLGLIRLEIAHLERILYHAGDESWRDLRDKVHDPQDVAIDNIIVGLDSKDIATGEHSRAVSSWSTRLARKMELSEHMVEKVTRGGLVHDVGKTTTPLEILTAPRRLSQEERAIMEHHVVAGWEMLQSIPALADFQSIVRHHHEKYAGGGYPDGLKGLEIPLSTRIVTVADCFNAMIGRRPYRVPLSPTGAVVELRRHRGGQFDPDVTDAMTEIVYEMIEKGGLDVPREHPYVPPVGLIED